MNQVQQMRVAAEIRMIRNENDFDYNSFYKILKDNNNNTLDSESEMKLTCYINSLYQKNSISSEEIDMIINLVCLFHQIKKWDTFMILNGLSHIANKVEARHIIWENENLIEVLSDISQNGSIRHWRKAAYIFCLITRPDTEKYIQEDILKSIIKLSLPAMLG